MLHYITIFSLFLFSFSFFSAYGVVDEISTDKSVYFNGDTLFISGSVSSEMENPSVNVLVFAPLHSTIVTIAFPPPTANSNGDFSTSINVGGPTWSTYGTYFVQVTSEGSSKEISIEYLESSTPEPTLEPTPSTPEPESIFTTLKLEIPNSPSFDKTPQYYIDRYNHDQNYKSWFDSQFPFNSINDVVGYKLTTLDGFPSIDKSPQYYLDKYHNLDGKNPNYKSWFDSTFPNSSIYNILGYVEPVSVPDWIRNNAEWWAIGEIPDYEFVAGIEYMLDKNIIMISNISPSGNISEDQIPEWIRNSAHWWSQDLISEDEFVSSLKFLLQEGIIIIK